MNEIPPLNAAALLKRYDLHARKGLGQNFLQDPLALEKIISAAEIQHTDSVLEIGPGLGSLTRYLAVAAKDVVAVELDPGLLPPLKAVLAPYSNVRVIHGDILKTSPKDFMLEGNYIVVANIPYYITSAVIRHLLESETQPRRIVLTVQKEVAQRICEEPGDMSLLALSVQVYGKPRIAARIPADAFFPAGMEPIEGVVDYSTGAFLGVRSADALLRVYGRDRWGWPVGVAHHLFADDVDAPASERAWGDWVAGVFENERVA